jgi:2-polyprenyl-6-methoxyphenol hydroxylase-like FAD-dependent oxidoreductase
MTRAADQPVLIIGAGIAGLTAATAFAQRGLDVVLIERKAELADEGGVGLTLVANALRALDEIGVADQCVDQGVPSDSLAMCKPDGTVFMESPLPRIGGPDLPGGAGISRTAFHAILARAARAAGVDIQCGLTVSDWQERPDGLDVRFSDGSDGSFSLMVGADGLYSATRGRLFPESHPQPAGQAVWRADCPRPDGIDKSHIHFGGKHGVVGICPIADDRAYLYIVENAPEFVRRDAATLHLQMQDELKGYGGALAQMSAQLDDPAKVSYRPLEWLLVPEPWAKGRTVLIGDAAHANPPVLAQGAAMGIEDAIVLAQEYAIDRSAMAAISRFAKRRYDRVKHVVDASCQLAKWEVEHTPGIDVPGVMRTAAMRLAEPI